MEPVKVPQHLDLDDQLAWGLTATDLLCLVGGAVVGWWLYLRVADSLLAQLMVATPPALVGLAFAVVRIGERSLRGWIVLALAYLGRSRVLTV